MPGGLCGWTKTSWTNSEIKREQSMKTKYYNLWGIWKHCLSIQGWSYESYIPAGIWAGPGCQIKGDLQMQRQYKKNVSSMLHDLLTERAIESSICLSLYLQDLTYVNILWVLGLQPREEICGACYSCIWIPEGGMQRGWALSVGTSDRPRWMGTH